MIDWHKYFEYKDGHLYHKYRDRNEFKRDCRFEHFNKNFAGKLAESISRVRVKNTFYDRVEVRVKEKPYLAHRVIYEMHNGSIPKGKNVDHINRKSTDNRVENLRVVTTQENMRNRKIHPRNKSGKLGVCMHKPTGKWRSYITIDRKQIHLGLFIDLEDAIKARKDADKKYGFIGE